jgi:hypothetical protein
LSIPAKGLLLPADASLESLIFDTLGAGVGFEQSPVVNPVAGIPVVEAKGFLWADACDHWGRDEAKDVAVKVWADAGLDGRAEVTSDELAAARSLLAERAANRDPFEGLPHAKPTIEGSGDSESTSGPVVGTPDPSQDEEGTDG